ncbi:DUF4349 domain-containing protein [Streptomyces sp. NRRL F-5135]|uniref:DUF4349 domain-containing protein n=1 Tax=Streptomyces sp. NRRL F-5135 TaxID=1463858 RepID=UPI00055CC9FE|nr:DUF4349 domain-containing protein [Streptomyces sp. NRRL F-5135]
MRAMPAFAAALLTVSVTLTGCGFGGEDEKALQSSAADAADGSQASGAAGESGRSGAAGPSAGSGAKGQQAKAPLPGSHVIRTARLTVGVEDTAKALVTARSAAERSGGLVENESTERTDDGHVMSTVVLRVPQREYDSVLAELAGTGTLIARGSEAKDVTDQVVDVNSRVASQRASVARVRELMDRADRLSDVVELEGELSTRQAALESLLAQQAALKDRTTLATITLELTETPAAENGKEDDPGFLDALAGGWDAFTATLRWIAVGVGAVTPFAVAFAALYALWRLVRGRLPRPPARRRPAAVPAAEGTPGQE